MKFKVIPMLSAVAFLALMVNVSAQINLNSNTINFRTYSTSNHSTIHYGDLHLEGGSSSTGWGWLYCNEIINTGPNYLYGAAFFYSGLSVISGTKNFIQPHPIDTTKVIKYIAIEAGEAMTMARGQSKTVSGSVEIILPEHFGFVTNAEQPLSVLLTPEEAPVLLYTASKSVNHITIVMKPSDFKEYGDASFSWQISGVRDGYENEQIICDTDSLLNGISDLGTSSEKRVKMNEWAKKMIVKTKKNHYHPIEKWPN